MGELHPLHSIYHKRWQFSICINRSGELTLKALPREGRRGHLIVDLQNAGEASLFAWLEEQKMPGTRETMQMAMAYGHCAPVSHRKSCIAKNQSPLIFSLSGTQWPMKAGDRSPAGIACSAADIWTAIGNRFYLFSLRRGIPFLFIVMRIQKNGLTIRSWQGPEGFS